MKQILKETIMVWIGLIFISASICVVLGVPLLFLYYVGIGVWQIIVSGLWLLFWLSFVITIIGKEETENEG